MKRLPVVQYQAEPTKLNFTVIAKFFTYISISRYKDDIKEQRPQHLAQSVATSIMVFHTLI